MFKASKTALITGASGKLGRAIAISLSQAGYNCICHYFHNDFDINELSARAIAVKCDFRDAGQIKKLFQNIPQDMIPEVLINSAGVFFPTDFDDVGSIRETFDINAISAILASKCFADLQSPGKFGHIINVAGISAVKPWPDYCAYSASKAGMVAATKSLAQKYAPDIAVNAVCPGIIDMPDDFTVEQKEQLLAKIPAGRFGCYDDITSAILFLLQSNYITGQIINIDGGRSM